MNGLCRDRGGRHLRGPAGTATPLRGGLLQQMRGVGRDV
jgi:hypothetical protein